MTYNLCRKTTGFLICCEKLFQKLSKLVKNAGNPSEKGEIFHMGFLLQSLLTGYHFGLCVGLPPFLGPRDVWHDGLSATFFGCLSHCGPSPFLGAPDGVLYMYVYVYLYMCMYVQHMYVNVYIYVYMYVYVHVYVYVYVSVSEYLYEDSVCEHVHVRVLYVPVHMSTFNPQCMCTWTCPCT